MEETWPGKVEDRHPVNIGCHKRSEVHIEVRGNVRRLDEVFECKTHLPLAVFQGQVVTMARQTGSVPTTFTVDQGNHQGVVRPESD